MKKFQVTQFLSNYSEVEYADACKTNLFVDFKWTIRYQVVTVTAKDEAEAIAHVREQQLLPTIPDQVVQLVKRLWGIDNVHHLHFAIDDINCLVLSVNELTHFIRSIMDSAIDGVLEEIENAETV